MAQHSFGSATATQLWEQCARWSTIFSSVLTLDYESFISGAIVLFPSVIAQVCVCHILEFTCNITGTLLEWTIPLIGSSHRFRYGISTSDSTETHNHQLTDNSTISIIISRISAEDSPVSSRLLISPATETHNDTEVTCEDVSSSVTESTTVIIFINGQIQGMHNNNYY